MAKELTDFEKTRKSTIQNEKTSKILEENQKNMFRIIENGQKMKTLFQTVGKQIKKMDKINNISDSIKKIEKNVV